MSLYPSTFLEEQMELIHIHKTKPDSRSACNAATPLLLRCETPPLSASLAELGVTRYLDSEDTLLMDGNDRIAFQMQVNFLQRKLRFCKKTQRKESTQLKQTQKRLVNTLDLLDRNEGHYLQLLNERTQKVHQLKKDLAKTQKQLDKTNQPAHHTGKVGKVVEEPLNLYHIKLSCADDIVSFSLGPVRQYIDEPFVDDGEDHVFIGSVLQGCTVVQCSGLARRCWLYAACFCVESWCSLCLL
ncbi:hypothetical protein Q8A73_015071 [Channa argus]|nr:hypothetical protein Q8A73_015071 [Channa argus]